MVLRLVSPLFRFAICRVVVPVVVLALALGFGLDCFIAIDDAFMEALLHPTDIGGFLVGLLWMTSQFDWMVLGGIGLTALFVAGKSSRLAAVIWTRGANWLAANPIGRSLASWTAISVAVYLTVWIGHTLLRDEVEITDLDEALLPFFLAALVITLPAALAGLRRVFEPGNPRPQQLANAAGAVALALIANFGDLQALNVTNLLAPSEAQAAAANLAAKAAKKELTRAQKRLVVEIEKQAVRAGRKLVVDAGGRVGAKMLSASKAAVDPAKAAARRLLINRNRVAGSLRQDMVREELKRLHPKATIVEEAMLRDSTGRIVRTEYGGRRIDMIVVEDGRVVRTVEVTSMNTDKMPQLAREERIKDAGGVFIEDPEGRLVSVLGAEDRLWRVDLDAKRIVKD